jgi:hypothetical protein
LIYKKKPIIYAQILIILNFIMKNILPFLALVTTLGITNVQSAPHELQKKSTEQEMAFPHFEHEGENMSENDDSFKQQEQYDEQINTDLNGEIQYCQNDMSLCGKQIAMASDNESDVYAKTTRSPPHFYVKLHKMNLGKVQCKQIAKNAMAISGFTDILPGKHGVWGVKQGYKAQIKCSKTEKVIVFIVVGEKGDTVMRFSDQLQRNFGQGFSVTRDP